jgi:hypothetical protein
MEEILIKTLNLKWYYGFNFWYFKFRLNKRRI